MERTTKPKLGNYCFAHCHMTCRQYGLWTRIRELQSKFGFVYFDADDLSAAFQNTSRDVIYDDCAELLKEGWFELRAPRNRKKDGTWEARKIAAIRHNEWVAKNPDKCAILNDHQSANSRPVHSANSDEPVGKQRPTSRQIAIDQSLPDDKDLVQSSSGSKERLDSNQTTEEASKSISSENPADKSFDQIASDIGANADKKSAVGAPTFLAPRSKRGKAELVRLLQQGYTQNQLQGAVWRLAESWDSTIRWDRPRPSQIEFFLENVEGEVAAIKKIWDERRKRDQWIESIPVKPLGEVSPEEEDEGITVDF